MNGQKQAFHRGDCGLHPLRIHVCGGGGGGSGGTNLQAERRHSQYEKHNVAGMTEGGDDDDDVKHVCVCRMKGCRVTSLLSATVQLVG